MIILKRFPNSVLLQDEDNYRFFVDKDIFVEGDIEKIRQYGIPYSLPFSLWVTEEQEKALYALGIHKLQDILDNRKKANSVLRNGEISAEDLIEIIKGESING